MEVIYTQIDGTKIYGDNPSQVNYPMNLIVPLGREVRYVHSEIGHLVEETELDGVPGYIGCQGERYFLRRIYAASGDLFAEYTTNLSHDYDTMPAKAFQAIHGEGAA